MYVNISKSLMVTGQWTLNIKFNKALKKEVH